MSKTKVGDVVKFPLNGLDYPVMWTSDIYPVISANTAITEETEFKVVDKQQVTRDGEPHPASKLEMVGDADSHPLQQWVLDEDLIVIKTESNE